MKGEELGKMLMDGLLVAEDGRLVAHDCVLVSLECIHVLADGDWCSWVSSQYASNRAVRSCTWSSSVVEGLTRSSS